MSRERDETGDQSPEGNDLDPRLRVRVRRRHNGGLRKMHRERERDEPRDKGEKRRRQPD